MKERIKKLIDRYFEDDLNEQELKEMNEAIRSNPDVAEYFRDVEFLEMKFREFGEHYYREKVKQIHNFLGPDQTFEESLEDMEAMQSYSREERDAFIEEIKKQSRNKKIIRISIIVAAAAVIFAALMIWIYPFRERDSTFDYTDFIKPEEVIIPHDSSTKDEDYNKAVTAYQDGRYPKAVSMTNDLLKSEPDNTNYLFLNALALYASDSTGQATDQFRKLVEEHPDLSKDIARTCYIFMSFYYMHHGVADSASYYLGKFKENNFARRGE